MSERHNVVIIGAGSAGLSTSYFLTQMGVPHVILERGQVAETWRSERWDAFHLVNPNWAIRLPGFHYRGGNPDGFLSKDETISYLERYAESLRPDILTGVEVTSISQDGGRYLLATTRGDILAHNVVVASGAFGVAHVPPISTAIAPDILQLHSIDYRNPQALPPGGVLVVGSGQSGAQIAEDLHDAGRHVYLSISRCGRRHRRYRGKDSSWWNWTTGQFDLTVKDVPRLEDRFRCSAHTSGTKGGHDIYLRRFAREGMALLGRIQDAEDRTLSIAGDVHTNLDYADMTAETWRGNVDRFVERHGLDAPEEPYPDPPELFAYPKGEPSRVLDLKREGITSIIWATGFRYDFSWIKLPVTYANGHPVQERGVTPCSGLFFMGLQWMYSAKSAQFIGIGEDAEYVAAKVAKGSGQ